MSAFSATSTLAENAVFIDVFVASSGVCSYNESEPGGATNADTGSDPHRLQWSAAMALNTKEKTCSSCKRLLPLPAFSKARWYKDGYRGQCKECRTAYTKSYNKNTNYKPQRVPAMPEDTRRRKLRQKYGLTVSEYDAMLEAQHGQCAICRTGEPRGRHNVFHVDHCHVTGRVRGLLCNSCNTVLGRLGDSLESVMRFVTYLQSGRP